jgi:hypothetical protein
MTATILRFPTRGLELTTAKLALARKQSKSQDRPVRNESRDSSATAVVGAVIIVFGVYVAARFASRLFK